MHIAVVILNWNTREYLRTFLPGVIHSCEWLSASSSNRYSAETVVADSASTDGSIELMAELFPTVKTIPLEANFGFTGGYNRALKGLEADCYLLLNSDVDVSEEWLLPLADWMENHPECGICGPKLHGYVNGVRTGRFEYAGAAGGYLDRFGFPFCRGRILDRIEEDYGQYDTPSDILWVSGACLMVRRRVWEALGGLDDRFFAHMEEIDLCWRAQIFGWKVTVVPQSTVWHLGGGTLPKESPWKLELNFRNNLLLLTKNLPDRLGSRLLIAFRYLLDVAAMAVYVLKGKFSFAAAVRKGHRGYFKLVGEGPKFCGSSSVNALKKVCILISGKYESENENL